MMTDKEKVKVIQAQIDGKEVQFRVRKGGVGNENEECNAHWFGYKWNDGAHHQFNFISYEYRVAPETIRVKLNDEYTAKIGEKTTKVGCQTFDNDVILRVADAIRKLA